MTTEEARTKGIILLTEEQIAKPNTGAANILRAVRDEFTKSHSREPDASEFEIAVGQGLLGLMAISKLEVKLTFEQFKQMLRDLGFVPEFVESRICVEDAVGPDYAFIVAWTRAGR